MARKINWTKLGVGVAVAGVVIAIFAIIVNIMTTKPAHSQKVDGDNSSQISVSGNNNPIQKNDRESNVAISGNNNQIFISKVGADNGIAKNNYPDLNLINLYKFQSLWDTNVGFYEGGKRNSYLSLLDMKKSDDPVIKKLASDAVEVIKNAYDGSNINVMVINIERWGYICKWSPPPFCTDGYEPAIGYNIKNVFDHLSFGKWQERARVACLLRNIDYPTNTHRSDVTKKEVREKLANLMGEQEPSLFVSKMALETYKALTPDFKSSGVFDFKEAIEDWEQRKKSF